ncbi:thiazole biosynthesis family protein [Sorangium sp. So ce1097]|uniref:thiazole biosynthesis family protein n=1 Tax=Sorangium sp. So ce1097 TaxID=3133330 RepID=UPI003F62259D
MNHAQNTVWDPEHFLCGGVRLRRLWLCFGTSGYAATEAEIVELLRVARTNVLPVNTHRLSTASGWDGLELGYGGVRLSGFTARHDLQGMLTMLNINHATSAAEAVDRARRAVELTGERIIKLEVLADDLRTSNQRAIVGAARALRAWRADLLVLPLLGADLAVAEELAAIGCPLLRVMGSPIGSGRGMDDERALERICALGLPVILDGGVGSLAQVKRALAFGVAGVLVNSMLYRGPEPSVEVMRGFADGFEQEVRALAPRAA